MAAAVHRAGYSEPPESELYPEPRKLNIQRFPAELWIMVAENLESRKSLLNFYGSCRHFRDLLRRVVFKEINITSSRKLARFDYNYWRRTPHMGRVKHLSVNIDDVHDFHQIDNPQFFRPAAMAHTFLLLNSKLIQCISMMPNLVSFSFGDVHDALAASKGPPAPESTNELPLFNIVMTHLRRLQKLRSLTIVMHKSAAEDIRNKGNPMSEMFWGRYVGSDLNLDLGGFRNLKTLRLLGIARRAGGSQTLAYQIATTLLASPNLQDFAIGLCEDYQLGRFYFFLDQLSQHYNALGGRQLPLKRLRICSRCDTYDSDGAHDGRPPFSSDMSSFCDLARLETLGLWDGWSTRNLPGRISEWNLQASVDSSMHINLIQSVRKFETIFLDDTMLSIIHTVGNDASLPPHFMSEIYISNIIYRDMMNRDAVRAKLQFSAAKSEYWPKVFCVDALEGSLAAIASTRRTILREICNWKGLQRLHIPMDLSVGEDRRLAFAMAKDLKKNLKVFSIDTRPMTFPVMEPTLANQMIYKQRASATASRHSECGYRISLAQKLETPEDKLRFAKKLFSEANLEYLGIFGTYFLFRKDVVRRFPGSRPFRLAWLKQLTFEKRDASELYKALFHSDHT